MALLDHDFRWRLRDLIARKPWLKWAAGAAVLLVAAYIAMWTLRPREDALLNRDRLAESVVVRYEDDGQTLTVPVGAVVSDLLNRAGLVSESSKLTNPKTKQQTGRVADAGAWAKIVSQVNDLKAREAAVH